MIAVAADELAVNATRVNLRLRCDVKAACRRQLQMNGSVREAAADRKATCRRQLQVKL